MNNEVSRTMHVCIPIAMLFAVRSAVSKILINKKGDRRSRKVILCLKRQENFTYTFFHNTQNNTLSVPLGVHLPMKKSSTTN